jgi:hypothetical protein
LRATFSAVSWQIRTLTAKPETYFSTLVETFERVLADLQLSPDPADKKRYDALVTAVVGLFNGMNQTFMHLPFEFESPPQVAYSLQSFLSWFHAISP